MKQLDTGRVVLAVTLIAAGVIILVVRRFGGTAETLWPFFIIIPGVALAALATTGGWRSKTAATAGFVVAGIGVILWVQELTNYYQSWAYAWALLPAFAGLGLFISGYRDNDEATQARARGLMQWGAAGFVVLAIAFETLIFHERAIFGGWLLPVVLIVAGALLLFGMPGRPGTEADKGPEADKEPKTDG
jgi:hypothetical protein